MRQDTPKPPTSEEALKELISEVADHMNDPNDAVEQEEDKSAATDAAPTTEATEAEPATKATADSEEEKKTESNEVTASSDTSDSAAASASNAQEGGAEETKTETAEQPASTSTAFDHEPENEAEESTQSATEQSTTVAATSDEEDEPVHKYMLLDRLFKFIEGDGVELINPVLAGYFSKVVQLLVNRKQKQIVPYIISDTSNVVENLLKHIYSRSIAEVVHRLLQIVESNFDDDISSKITQKKQKIMSSLIG